MKIGIDCENIQGGARWGISQIILNIIKEYQQNPELKKSHSLCLYFKDYIPKDSTLDDSALIKKVIKLPILKKTPFNIYYHLLLPIRATLDKLDMMFFPPYMLPPLYLPKSMVLLTPDVNYEYKKGSLPFRYKLAYRLFSNWAAMRASKILAISESSKKELIKLYGIKPEKIWVSLLGISPEKIDKNSSVTNTNFPYILYVGQMFPRRRAKESIQAFAIIAKEFPDLKFILVGHDKYPQPIIKELVKKVNLELDSDRIIYHDYISNDDNLVQIYKNAKLFIYVSSSEAFGLPPVEAACHKVPVVVKDNDLNHELFGNAAFFVNDESDPHKIADTLRRGLIDTEHRNYCVSQYQNLPERLNWKNFTKKFFEIAST